MKVVSFFIATLLVLQTASPALCLTRCLDESDKVCRMESKENDAKSSCGEEVKSETCCSHEQLNSSSSPKTEHINASQQHETPCNACRIPCCAGTLCCFYFQEITELDFSVDGVLVTGPLPSNNGSPVSGHLDECFQPPEVI